MGTKGKEFLADATRLGWTGFTGNEGQREICQVEFVNPESSAKTTLVMIWDGQRYNDKDSHRLDGKGNRRAIRNASAARKMLQEVTGGKLEKSPGRSKREPALKDDFDTPDRPQQGVRPPARNLPFKISWSDEKIIEAVRGKQVSWWSDQRREVMSARIMKDPDQRHLKIISARGKRTLHWAAAGEGFRAVYLDNIIEVRG